MTKRTCRTCRYWDMHSLEMKLGDCRAPDNHRYWRVETRLLPEGTTALMDSFGPEETKPGYSCHAWELGADDDSATLTSGDR